ncbi:MAG: thiamine pyrophosphate-dependent dehydrogenase E1 component subunit alpha [Eubacteriaceae bacterium]|jgi:pyruvate dehydrogenase E1 component alpha subunit|nr:thiamine pyrophosphate-dependent dehydrogenase E1 component subunit alpha [Eubacteriaceae bacterium]
MSEYECLPKSKKIDMHRTMLLSRHFELKVNEMFMKGMIHGTTHLGIGQEANHAGVGSALEAKDWIFTTHRGHGHFLARGGSAQDLMAELFGLPSGVNKGLGGSMHLTDVGHNNMGASGIVAGNVPIAVGAAFALKRSASGAVAVCFLGDGAANQGMALESLNLASVWRVPILFYCENNQYAMSAPYRDFAGGQDLPLRAKAFGLESGRIDGNSLPEVYDALKSALAYVRAECRPFFLESVTYRQLGHSKSDQRKYRTKKEEEDWIKRCPIARNAEHLESSGVATPDSLRKLSEDAAREVERAAESCLREKGGSLSLAEAEALARSERPGGAFPSHCPSRQESRAL